MGLADSNGEFSFTINYEVAFGAGLDVIIRCRNQGFPNAAIQDDGGSFTDETSNANSATADDMNIFPFGPQTDDAYYFGHSEQFFNMKLDITTAATYSIPSNVDAQWEYYNGSAWSALPNLSDGTEDGNGVALGSTGEGTVFWTDPGNWATFTQNSQGPYYYIRLRENAPFPGYLTVPKARKAKLDVTRYLPFAQLNTITSSGLNVVAVWIEDNISTF